MAKGSSKKLAKKDVARAIKQATNKTSKKSRVKAAKPVAAKAAKPVAAKAAKPVAAKAAKPAAAKAAKPAAAKAAKPAAAKAAKPVAAKAAKPVAAKAAKPVAAKRTVPVAARAIKKPIVTKAAAQRPMAPNALRVKTPIARRTKALGAKNVAGKPAKPLAPKTALTNESADISDSFAFSGQGPRPAPRVHHAPLTARERQVLKKALVEERDRIIAFLDSLDGKSLNHTAGEGERDRSSYSIHQADYASDNQSLNLALVQRQIESARLEEIEWAFKQVETKTYGRCRRCTANIGFERMQAKPYAEYCIVCHTEMEPAR